jgi:hypothetical protein
MISGAILLIMVTTTAYLHLKNNNSLNVLNLYSNKNMVIQSNDENL